MIYTIGEILIDFMQTGDAYMPYPGGAPANVAIHARRMGIETSFIGKLSNDTFGQKLDEFLKANDIINPISRSNKNTTLAIVSHNNGERSFSFYRTNTADLDLSPNDLISVNFKSSDILHLCSLGLVNDGSTREAHHFAIEAIKSVNGVVSFDVNLREGLWENLEDAKNAINYVIDFADILKVNFEELVWLTDETNIVTAAQKIHMTGKLLIVTLGEDGSLALLPNGEIVQQNIKPIHAIDTTGAGDSFIATILADFHKKHDCDMQRLDCEAVDSMLKHANYVASQVVLQKGAVPHVDYEGAFE